jgi:hypothetical protein
MKIESKSSNHAIIHTEASWELTGQRLIEVIPVTSSKDEDNLLAKMKSSLSRIPSFWTGHIIKIDGALKHVTDVEMTQTEGKIIFVYVLADGEKPSPPEWITVHDN